MSDPPCAWARCFFSDHCARPNCAYLAFYEAASSVNAAQLRAALQRHGSAPLVAEYGHYNFMLQDLCFAHRRAGDAPVREYVFALVKVIGVAGLVAPDRFGRCGLMRIVQLERSARGQNVELLSGLVLDHGVPQAEITCALWQEIMQWAHPTNYGWMMRDCPLGDEGRARLLASAMFPHFSDGSPSERLRGLITKGGAAQVALTARYGRAKNTLLHMAVQACYHARAHRMVYKGAWSLRELQATFILLVDEVGIDPLTPNAHGELVPALAASASEYGTPPSELGPSECGQIRAMAQRLVDFNAERVLAVAMAIHPRLGAASPLGAVSDLLRAFVVPHVARCYVSARE